MLILQIAAATWIVTGVATAVVMARRGHDAVLWMVIGIVLGPVAAIMSILAARDDRSAPVRIVASGLRGRGELDVLVGIDGSAQSDAAVLDVLRLFGHHLRRLTLATVVDYDVAENETVVAEFGRRMRERAARLAPHLAPELVVLPGAPADALVRYATEHDFDFVAVGARSEEPKGVLGSVASRLASASAVPVLIASGAASVAGDREGDSAWSVY